MTSKYKILLAAFAAIMFAAGVLMGISLAKDNSNYALVAAGVALAGGLLTAIIAVLIRKK